MFDDGVDIQPCDRFSGQEDSMSLQTIKPLMRKARELYPSRHMQHQWVRKYSYLIESGKHVAINGKYPTKH
jgi:hypothetical protein